MEQAARNELVLENLPLVGYLASELVAKATHLSHEDLVSVGTLAMIAAADAFDASLGVPFGAYARRRILGAFADDMRSNDWATRGARKKITALRSIEESLTAALGRNPSIREMADALGMADSEVRSIMEDAERTVVTLEGSDHNHLAAAFGIPGEELLDSERRSKIHGAVEALPEKMQTLIRRLYFEGATVKQIAAESGVTHSAISQQRSAAIKLLHEALQGSYFTEEAPLPEAKLTKSAAARREQYLADFARLNAGSIPASTALPVA